jgi:thioredoxin-related protein
MNKIRQIIGILFIAFLFSNNLSANSGIQFQYGDIDLAKYQASVEGKLYLVEFYADWCAPCKWMDQTTFSNSEVISVINSSFVPVKINIDDIDGFAWKQQYDVDILPTILIFNSKGKLIDRLEESVAPTEFLTLLRKHNVHSNKVVSPMSENVSPRDFTLNNKPQNKNYISPQYYNPQAGKSIYRLQMGSFSDYDEVINLYNDLKDEFIEPIIVLNDLEQGKTMYKVLMGEFQTEEEATGFKNILQNDFQYNSILY